MTTQLTADVDALRTLAGEMEMDCEIDGGESSILITMGTGEEEPARNYEDGARILREYRACGAA